MRYIGGKHRIAKQLAASILPHLRGRQLVEPFCGGLSATVALQPQEASDASDPLIRLILAVREGWEPDASAISDKEYRLSRSKPDAEMSLQDIFRCLCCSFGGKWKGGLARGGNFEPDRDFPKQGKNSLLRKVRATMDVRFSCKDYRDYEPSSDNVFYCDPPYKGVTNGYSTGPFDSDAFWDWAKWAGNQGALLFVSEFGGPTWAEVHAEFVSKTDLIKKSGNQGTIEKLFAVGELP